MHRYLSVRYGEGEIAGASTFEAMDAPKHHIAIEGNRGLNPVSCKWCKEIMLEVYR